MIAVRKLEETDWQQLREIRLQALKTDPGVFGSNYQKESEMTEQDWRGWLSNADAVCFGLFEDSKIIGLTGIAIDRADASRKTAILWGSWLKPEYRERGLSRQMYESRLAWARNHPTCEKVIVSHRASNLASKYANQRHGFVLTHSTHKQWPDGTFEDDIFYELKVKSG